MTYANLYAFAMANPYPFALMFLGVLAFTAWAVAR